MQDKGNVKEENKFMIKPLSLKLSKATGAQVSDSRRIGTGQSKLNNYSKAGSQKTIY